MRHRPQGTRDEWAARVESIRDVHLRHLCAMCLWFDRAPEDYDAFWSPWFSKYSHHYRYAQKISMKRFKKALAMIGYKNPEKRVTGYRRAQKYA